VAWSLPVIHPLAQPNFKARLVGWLPGWLVGWLEESLLSYAGGVGWLVGWQIVRATRSECNPHSCVAWTLHVIYPFAQPNFKPSLHVITNQVLKVSRGPRVTGSRPQQSRVSPGGSQTREGFAPWWAHPPTAAAPPLAVPTPQGGDSSKRTGCYDVMVMPSFGVSDLADRSRRHCPYPKQRPRRINGLLV
jgi:hypothetical protein